MRFDYGRSNPPGDKPIAGSQVEEVGNNFSVTIPSFTVTVLLIPQAH
jgi:hypothetical protein